jgi:hypothetical protein
VIETAGEDDMSCRVWVLRLFEKTERQRDDGDERKPRVGEPGWRRGTK